MPRRGRGTPQTATGNANSPLPAGNSTNEPTIITADQLHGDYANNVGTFEGNVLAVDPRMTVRGDKMTVFFGSTNVITSAGTNTTRAVQKIIAEGDVVITTPDNKKPNSDRAEYTALDGKVVLTGHPRAESSDGVVTGNKITFWRDSQRMDVEAEDRNEPNHCSSIPKNSGSKTATRPESRKIRRRDVLKPPARVARVFTPRRVEVRRQIENRHGSWLRMGLGHGPF